MFRPGLGIDAPALSPGSRQPRIPDRGCRRLLRLLRDSGRFGGEGLVLIRGRSLARGGPELELRAVDAGRLGPGGLVAGGPAPNAAPACWGTGTTPAGARAATARRGRSTPSGMCCAGWRRYRADRSRPHLRALLPTGSANSWSAPAAVALRVRRPAAGDRGAQRLDLWPAVAGARRRDLTSGYTSALAMRASPIPDGGVASKHFPSRLACKLIPRPGQYQCGTTVMGDRCV